nr:MAG TPA: hypothetical protein [Bacteriophage sp.]DAZ77212.1 MAG TPA: hypothetical protein [Caudoviricetes sp.]
MRGTSVTIAAKLTNATKPQAQDEKSCVKAILFLAST